MRCFYSENLELELPAGHPFPMDKFRVSKDMLLDGGILRPEEIIEVRRADVHLLQRVHEPEYIRSIESGLLGRKEQILLGLPVSPQLFDRSATEVEAINVIGEVEGRDVLLVDDMTETAGTLTAAATLLRERGAKRIYAGVSHGILNELALRRLAESPIEELICTDSTPMAVGHKVTTLSIAEILGEAIRRIHQGESVTSLFDIR